MKNIAVLGKKGMGKSHYVRHILAPIPHFIYDPMGEHKGLFRYVPRDRASIEEFNSWCHLVWMDRRYWNRAIAIDEANRYLKEHRAIPKWAGEILDLGRHHNQPLVTIARRPAQINKDALELADEVVCFKLNGKNDVRALNDECEGMGDAVKALEKRYYVVYDGNGFIVCPPVPG
jgi:hypothetical protein